jgi:hypothetical protein
MYIPCCDESTSFSTFFRRKTFRPFVNLFVGHSSGCREKTSKQGSSNINSCRGSFLKGQLIPDLEAATAAYAGSLCRKDLCTYLILELEATTAAKENWVGSKSYLRVLNSKQQQLQGQLVT